MIYQTQQNQKGFTLIEIMVSVSIFAMVMMVAIGAVLSIVAANKKAQALNSVITNLNFAMEGMLRDLRTGFDYDCGADTSNSLTDCPQIPEESVGFYSVQYDKNIIYGLANNKIYKRVDGQDYFLTGDDIVIKHLYFYVVGSASSSNGDYVEPHILVVIQGSFAGYGSTTDFNLQTLVSQRRLDL